MPRGVYVRRKDLKLSEETKRKISQTLKGHKVSDESRLKMRRAKLGKKLSEEHRRKLSEKLMGNTRTLGFKQSEETKLKKSKALTGLKRSPDFSRHMSEIQKGNKNNAWKGDEVGYQGLHIWVRKELGNASVCELADETCKGRFEWANISQEYHRDLKDWQQLCMSHHRRYDNEWKRRNGHSPGYRLARKER